MSRAGAFALLLLFISGVVTYNCTYEDVDGAVYNLQSMSIPTNSSGTSFYYFNNTRDSGRGEYFVDICQPLNPSLGCKVNTTVCQTTGSGQNYSCGVVSTQVFQSYAGVGSVNGKNITN